MKPPSPRPTALRWGVIGLMSVLLICGLNACALTFIPLVPTPIQLEPRLVLGASSNLTRRGPEIVLHLDFARVPGEGYISVFLYQASSNGGESKIAEDSKLINPQTQVLELRLAPAVVGKYRALVFWAGSVERQFEFELQ